MRTVTLIPGDGIGPEVAEVMVRVVDASGAKINWERADAGADALSSHGSPLPEETINSICRNKIAIKVN